MQSSFPSIAGAIKQKRFLQFFPVDWILTEQFNSISHIRSLQMPVLFLHGTDDPIVPPEMSQQLYNAAPAPKQLFLIAGAKHVRIYQPGEQSYLRAIQRFVKTLPQK